MIHAFESLGIYLVLDVESGALHQLDKLAYDVVKALEDGKTPYGAGGKEDVQDVLGELEELRQAGLYDTPAQPYAPIEGPKVIKSLCLNVAHDCNMRCGYCFAATGEYHLGRALMPYEVGERALDFLLAHSGERKHLEVDFFGGEPLMNWDVVKKLVAYGRELEKKTGKSIAFTITTNGLLIDDEIVEFCNREMHNVVISLDGRRAVHDNVRKSVNGKGTYDIVIEKAKKLGLSRQELGKEYYIRGTFTKANLDFSQDVLALADMGFEQISVEPVVLGEGEPNALTEKDLDRIGEEYEKLALEYVKRRSDGQWFNFFHFMLDEEGPCLAKRTMGCGAGSEYVAVTPQGDIYPCHQFVGRQGFVMGSVLTGELDESIQDSFRRCNITTKRACKDCWAKYHCCGGCAANAHSYGGGIDKPYAVACGIQKERLERAMAVYAKEKESL